ncbi:MAG TPA: hydroxymethylpyrimidine/phosphomethylpyrimidine kinase [Anaeromyxobacteraceae bacterium]|nr:hydroxymethylpyrimidine/phosphomethylpyrimidine kinase [Anaeromyxobacteraceae bacterium]
MNRPAVLVAAGLDPTGGAGLAADIEALLAIGTRPLPVATALTVQGRAGAIRYRSVSAQLLLDQIEGLFRGRGYRPAAVKIGMLGSGANALVLARVAQGRHLSGLPLVVDPVLAASSGLALFEDTRGRGAATVLAPLLSLATVVTPNRLELAVLAGKRQGSLLSDDDAVEAARRLPCPSVLVKGGHRRGAPVDLLVRGHEVLRFTGQRRRGTARGTGCRLASALAGLLAQGARLEEAVRGAKALVERYLDGELGPLEANGLENTAGGGGPRRAPALRAGARTISSRAASPRRRYSP